jgi:phosphomannomutase
VPEGRANDALLRWGVATTRKAKRVPTFPRLIAFDLDDTLAASKAPIDASVSGALVELSGFMDVCIISGGQFGQFRSQVLNNLPEAADQKLARFHLMPTCGTQYYRWSNGNWAQVYAENLTADETRRALNSVEDAARALGLWEAQPWGPILEDRGSQVTFSALGQEAPVAAKIKWDPSDEKKNALRDEVAKRLPDLEVRSGGSTSIDITRKGIDKAYGMKRLSSITAIPLSEMLFVGDRLDVDGNDYPVRVLGVPCHEVDGWHDTVDFLDQFLARLRAAA